MKTDNAPIMMKYSVPAASPNGTVVRQASVVLPRKLGVDIVGVPGRRQAQLTQWVDQKRASRRAGAIGVPQVSHTP